MAFMTVTDHPSSRRSREVELGRVSVQVLCADVTVVNNRLELSEAPSTRLENAQPFTRWSGPFEGGYEALAIGAGRDLWLELRADTPVSIF